MWNRQIWPQKHWKQIRIQIHIHDPYVCATGFVEIPNMAVHLGVKMADTLSFTAKMDMVDFWV